MQIEVTDEMREAVKRVKEAQQNLSDNKRTNPPLFQELADERRHFANLVIAAIEEQTAKEGA
jgi:hypothetical protein